MEARLQRPDASDGARTQQATTDRREAVRPVQMPDTIECESGDGRRSTPCDSSRSRSTRGRSSPTRTPEVREPPHGRQVGH